MYNIKPRTDYGYFNVNCVACGRRSETGGVEALLYFGDDAVGHVCETCFSLGPEAFSKLLRADAEEAVKYYRREAERLAEADVIFPHPDETAAAEKDHKEREEEIRRDYEASLAETRHGNVNEVVYVADEDFPF